MLSQYIKKTLEEQLGKKMTAKVEQELDLWYHVTLDEASYQFEKLDRVLSSIYGKSAARALERRFLKTIIHTDSSSIDDDDKNARANPKRQDQRQQQQRQYVAVTITEPQLVQSILTVIEDESFRKIFDVMNNNDKNKDNKDNHHYLSFEQILTTCL